MEANGEKITDYIEFPEPFGTQYYCSDPECPCNETAIPPAKGYLFISPETVNFRKDCLTLDAYWAKIDRIKKQIKSAKLVPGPGTMGLPIVICEQGAKLKYLDLDVAAADFDLWASNKPIPCRPTPTK